MVTVAAATTRDVPVYLDEIGKTVPVEMVAVVPQVGGKLTAVHVVDGAYVKKGQLLFEIDPRPSEAALASAEATVAQTTAELEWAKIDEKRVKDLFSQSSATEFEYDQKRVAVAVAQAKLEGAKAAVESAKLDLEYCKIFSPLDGRAGARLVDPGNIVKANDKPLLVIQRLDPIYAEFTVTETTLATVRKHMAARGPGGAAEQVLRVDVDMPSDPMNVLAALGAPVSRPADGCPAETRPAGRAGLDLPTQPAEEGQSAEEGRPRPALHAPSQPVGGSDPTSGGRGGAREGKLTFLDNSVQNGTGTVKLRATVSNPDGYFWPGQFVNVRLILTMRDDAVLIPAQAQQVGQQGAYVYVVEPGNIAQMRPIVLGQRYGDMLAVDQGLQAGEKVIVTGQMMVMPGAKVTVVPGGPGQGPPGAPDPGHRGRQERRRAVPLLPRRWRRRGSEKVRKCESGKVRKWEGTRE